MNTEFIKGFREIIQSNYRFFILVVLIPLVAGGLYLYNDLPKEKVALPEEIVAEVTTDEGPVLERSIPARLRIPELNIDASFEAPLGLETNGEVGVPDSYTKVGWYQHSPTPGELGPAVILGHIDSTTGPAVFFYLGQLKVGSDIFVDREDGSTAHFKVEGLERYKQSEFPTAKVYGDINFAGLRVITCSGTYKKGEQRYTHNLVVYARLVNEEKSGG